MWGGRKTAPTFLTVAVLYTGPNRGADIVETLCLLGIFVCRDQFRQHGLDFLRNEAQLPAPVGVVLPLDGYRAKLH
jgi:hypothetical protein